MADERWYAKGEETLVVSAEDNWYVIKAGVAEGDAVNDADLGGYGEIELVFGDVRVPRRDMEGYSLQRGECVFFLGREDAGRVRLRADRWWTLVAGGVSVYGGRWRKEEEASVEDLGAEIERLSAESLRWKQMYETEQGEHERDEARWDAERSSLVAALEAAEGEARRYAEELEALKGSMKEANVVERTVTEVPVATATALKTDLFRVTKATETGTYKVSVAGAERISAGQEVYKLTNVAL